MCLLAFPDLSIFVSMRPIPCLPLCLPLLHLYVRHLQHPDRLVPTPNCRHPLHHLTTARPCLGPG